MSQKLRPLGAFLSELGYTPPTGRAPEWVLLERRVEALFEWLQLNVNRENVLNSSEASEYSKLLASGEFIADPDKLEEAEAEVQAALEAEQRRKRMDEERCGKLHKELADIETKMTALDKASSSLSSSSSSSSSSNHKTESYSISDVSTRIRTAREEANKMFLNISKLIKDAKELNTLSTDSSRPIGVGTIGDILSAEAKIEQLSSKIDNNGTTENGSTAKGWDRDDVEFELQRLEKAIENALREKVELTSRLNLLSGSISSLEETLNGKEEIHNPYLDQRDIQLAEQLDAITSKCQKSVPNAAKAACAQGGVLTSALQSKLAQLQYRNNFAKAIETRLRRSKARLGLLENIMKEEYSDEQKAQNALENVVEIMTQYSTAAYKLVESINEMERTIETACVNAEKNIEKDNVFAEKLLVLSQNPISFDVNNDNNNKDNNDSNNQKLKIQNFESLQHDITSISASCLKDMELRVTPYANMELSTVEGTWKLAQQQMKLLSK